MEKSSGNRGGSGKAGSLSLACSQLLPEAFMIALLFLIVLSLCAYIGSTETINKEGCN